MKERNLISILASRFFTDHPSLVKGIGDDCAVFRESESKCRMISTDLLVENIHFKRSWQEPFSLGRKAVNVNLSDIAAMGGKPDFIILSLGIPDSINDEWLNLFFQGVEATLRKNNCILIGGDTTSSEKLLINVGVLGVARCDHVIYRSGADLEDDVYVTGKLGQSAAGLEILKSAHGYPAKFGVLIDAHLHPQPQLQMGRLLAERGLVNAMQDISDGLSTDLGHICKESGVGAVLEEKKLPECSIVKDFCQSNSLDILDFMLHGGEDYQLVFTAAKKNRAEVEKLSRELGQMVYKIGRISEKKGVYLASDSGEFSEISFGGFEHCG